MRKRLGRHLFRFHPFHYQRPPWKVACHRLLGGVRIQVELRGRRFTAVASGAIFSDKRPHVLLELPVEIGGCRRGEPTETLTESNRTEREFSCMKDGLSRIRHLPDMKGYPHADV
jgi:hypothetical protein